MTITLKEAPGSSRTTLGSSPTHQKLMIVAGATTYDEAVDALMAASTECPEELTITLTDARVYIFKKNLARADPINEPTPTYWLGTVDYILKEFVTPPYNTGDYAQSFAIGMKQQNMKLAREEIASYGATGVTPANKKGAIGVNADEVAGVDVQVPTFKFHETHYIAESAMTQTYVDAIWGVSNNPVNDAEFRGFPASTVLFNGVSGTRRTKEGDWELSFEFTVSPNSTNAAPSSGITGIVKKGWEYLWFSYQSADSNDARVLWPRAAYVDKVYNESNFTALGIGTDSLFGA